MRWGEGHEIDGQAFIPLPLFMAGTGWVVLPSLPQRVWMRGTDGADDELGTSCTHLQYLDTVQYGVSSGYGTQNHSSKPCPGSIRPTTICSFRYDRRTRPYPPSCTIPYVFSRVWLS